MRALAVRILTSISVALFVLAIVAAPSSAVSAGIATGFGAPFAQWVHTHPPDQQGCAIGTCYGPMVNSASRSPEFSFVQTFRGHVVGYDESIARGTSLLEAEIEVAQQFPADVSMSSRLMVIRRDHFGHSCAVYDLYSKALAREFGSKGPAHQGDSVGVELATLAPNGTTTYNPTSIDLAIVSPMYIDDTTSC
jgi:hypothetical protein